MSNFKNIRGQYGQPSAEQRQEHIRTLGQQVQGLAGAMMAGPISVALANAAEFEDAITRLDTVIGQDARPSFDDVFMRMASVVSERGTCPRRKVGAVIVNARNHIIATGYNGAPKGLPHCTEYGCLIAEPARQECTFCHGKGYFMRLIPTRKEGKLGELARKEECPHCQGLGYSGSCSRTTHAEANALVQCALSGSSPEGGKLYVTDRPCVACSGLLITAGITEIQYINQYLSDGLDEEVHEMFATAGVTVRRR